MRSHPPMRPGVVRRTRAAALSLLVVSGVLAAGCARRDPEAREVPKAPSPVVATQDLALEDYPYTLRFVGRLAPRTEVEMAFEIGGTVEAVRVDEGDRVAEGDTLAQLDTALLRTELAEAEANLAIAEREARRSARLFEQAVVPEARREDAASRAALARATRSGIRERIAKATLRSPIAGRVAFRDLELRETVQPHRPVLRIVDVEAVILDLWVPDHQIAQVGVGQTVAVSFEAFPGEAFEGTVTRVAVDADAERRLFKVETTLANPGERLKPGMIGTAKIEVARLERVAVIPLRYSVVRDGERVVFVERESVAERHVLDGFLIHEANLIVRDPDRLLAGRLITDGMQQLTGGEAVRTAPPLRTVTGGGTETAEAGS